IHHHSFTHFLTYNPNNPILMTDAVLNKKAKNHNNREKFV
ncbi:hypothetical protein HMPREF3208_00862, partial [Gardnerella vaginalis]